MILTYQVMQQQHLLSSKAQHLHILIAILFPLNTGLAQYTVKILAASNTFGVDHCLDISPGDHIVFSCWIKTSGATLSADYNNPQAGGRIGIDFYGSLGGISASCVPDGTTSTTSNPYGSNTDTYNT